MAERSKLSRSSLRRSGGSGGGSGGLGVTKIIAGTNITVSPVSGVGAVTVNATVPPATVTSVASADPGIVVTNTAGSVVLQQNLGAEWTVGLCRVYAIDGVNGNDANKGYADPATSSAGDYAIACAAAGAVAKKTIAGLAAIFPRTGNGRTVEVVIAAGTYAGSPADFLKGATGYATLPVVRGTSTNATAGATAFGGNAADATYVGGVTSAGLNAAGYNPNGTITTTSIECVKAGGGAPTFGAVPAVPVGQRIRFDSATATAALRNVCRQVCQTSGTDTVILQTAEPALPVGTDVFYTEAPGVVFTGNPNFDSAGTQGAIFVGMDFGSAAVLNNTCGRFTYVFCSVENQWTYNGADELVTTAQSYTHPVLGSLTVGGGLRCTVALLSRAQFALAGLVSTGTTTISGPRNTSAWGAGCAANNLRLGNWIGNQNFDGFQGPNIGVTHGLAGVPYTYGNGSGSGVEVDGCLISIGDINNTGAGANPVYQLLARNKLIIKGVIGGSTGNTDVGFDLQNAFETTIEIGNLVLPTVTGTAGDVRWNGQALTAWTNFGFQEGWDTSNNHILETGTNGPNSFATSPSVIKGVNNSGAAIASAFQLVRSNGTNLQFVPAQADSAADAAGFMGISEAITQNGATGLVAMPEGARICHFDSAPVVGGIVYLSPSTAGAATTTVPALSGTNQKLRLGICIGNSFAGNIGLVRWNPENIPTLADGNP